MELSGQVAVITGGSRGIGRGIALSMAAAGADIVINYRKDENAAAETAKAVNDLGRRSALAPGDVSDWESAGRVIKKAFDAFGRIDILVNNAGIASRGNIVDKIDPIEWNRVMMTNLYSVFNCSKSVLPYMHQAKKGVIINITSIAAQTLAAASAPYSIAKAGVDAFTKVLAREEGPKGIRVNAIGPGIVKTEMGDRLMKAWGEEVVKSRLQATPLRRIAYPEDIGNVAVFLASEKASYITGKIFHLDGGIL